MAVPAPADASGPMRGRRWWPLHALLLAGLAVAPFDLRVLRLVHANLGAFLDERWALIDVPFRAVQFLVPSALGWAGLALARGGCPGACLTRRASTLWVLCGVFGGGLLVNGLCKPTWGRPRPRQLLEFGGDEPFHGLWQVDWFGPGRSFASGHAAAAALLLALLWLVRPGRTRTALLWTLVPLWGWVGLSRVLAGAHFPSDVLLGSWLALVPLPLLTRLLPGAPSHDPDAHP